MEDSNCEKDDQLQPIAECFIKREIDYESPSESQDDEVAEEDPLYSNTVETNEKFSEENVEDPVSQNENQEVYAEPGSSVLSSSSEFEPEADIELIVPDLITRKKKSSSREQEEFSTGPLLGVEEAGTTVQTVVNNCNNSFTGNSTINATTTSKTKGRKRKVIDPHKKRTSKKKVTDDSKMIINLDISKSSNVVSDFDPSLVILPNLEVNPCLKVDDKSAIDVSVSAVDPITIHVDPGDYKTEHEVGRSSIDCNFAADPGELPTGDFISSSFPTKSDSDPNQSNYDSSNKSLSLVNSNPEVTLKKCTSCEFSCFNSTTFASHILTHKHPSQGLHSVVDSSKPKVTLLKCNLCKFSCFNPTNFETHMSTKHKPQKQGRKRGLGRQSSQCAYCDFKCVKPQDMKVHSETHLGKRFFECDECELKFSNTKGLVWHMEKHNKREKYSCKHCEVCLSSVQEFADHLNSHEVISPFLCCVCNIVFDSQKLLNHHQTAVHSKAGVDTLVCSACFQVFSNESHLREHEKVEGHEKCDSSQETFECSVCDQCFSTQKLLRAHQRAEHKDKKLFQCVFCNYKCSESGRLKTHLRTHTGEKPYQCEFCGHRCADPSALKSHLRTHTGEKPFQCTECDAKFRKSNTLNTHMLAHSQNKRFKCAICSFSSDRKSNLKTHMKTQHEAV